MHPGVRFLQIFPFYKGNPITAYAVNNVGIPVIVSKEAAAYQIFLHPCPPAAAGDLKHTKKHPALYPEISCISILLSSELKA